MAPEKDQNPLKDEYSLFTQCVSELMGTFIMVMIGSGAECISLYLDDASSVNVPMLWVVGATLGIYIAISTGHLNPAVTLAFALVRPGAFPMRKVVPYWMAQVGGAMLAGVANFWLFYGAIENYEERHVSPFANSRGMKKSKDSECSEYDRANLQSASAFGNFWSLSGVVADAYHACFIEAFGTAFIVFIIFFVTSPLYTIPGAAVPPIAAIAIGAMVAILGPLTGGSINPARDLGLRLAAMSMHWGKEVFTDIFPYMVGPLIGGPLGAWFAETILRMS